MKGKLKIIKDELKRQLKIITISSTVIINLLYISYLRFALRHGIGNRYVNFALTIATALFLLLYLIFRLFGENKKNVKRTKRIYKRFKLLTKLFTVLTAIYVLITATGSVTPMAGIFAYLNAILLALQLIFELVASLITRGARRVKESVSERLREPKKLKITSDTVSEERVEITQNDL
jgi:uncharacterized membrane protein